MTDSTIALIEPEPYRYRRRSWPTWSYGTMADIKSYEAFWRCPMEYELLVPATELTTLLQRVEKAEAENAKLREIAETNGRTADFWKFRAEVYVSQRDEARKALEPFVAVLEQDISADETDEDIFQPMREYNRAPLLTIGHFRAARDAGGKPE